MKVFLTIVTLLLSVVVCRTRAPFSTSGCQEVKSPVCNADIGVSFFPHETDCALFYVCNNGRLSTQACPQGQYFYDQSDLCVLSSCVRCDRCASNKARCEECGCGEIKNPSPRQSINYQPTTERVTSYQPTTERVTPIHPTTERVTADFTTSNEITSSTNLDTTTLFPECPAIPTCSPEEDGLVKPYPPDCTKYIYIATLMEMGY